MEQINDTSQNLVNTGAQRDAKGRILPGVAINPAGRPKGARHMSTLLMEAIKKVAEGDAEPADILIVKKLVEKAKAGNDKSIETIFDRVDGKAEQKIDITSNDETLGESSAIKDLTNTLNELYRNRS